MKGVVLAGGLGTRLGSLTKITNKHLLPVYDRPMVFFPIQKLVEAGVGEVIVVTGGNSAGDFLRLLENGRGFGLRRIHYTYQEGSGGIAAALALAEDFVEGERVMVLLGDNLFEESLAPFAERFATQARGARVLLKEVPDPERFGVATVSEGRVMRIVEKPEKPESRFAVTGCYLYDERVFDIVRTLEPSARGELEITDVNNAYLKAGELEYDLLSGWWQDAGSSFEAYARAQSLVREQCRGAGA
ncbi:MAG TPA: spore coat protein [candidate division WOR-3 bacterium]|uniref:glucose-1-phosphate thymidylyltransferase n=1 Tax=candidate division WOR-3 bacterium TaxID=2052148 RepID=A0A7V0XFR8_UNCW3|nr:spore coat protein [candidate division WOR-3 bacterium]